jgi:diacylglycerol diphosphate phosphatase / phosphatidate phosphatase
MGREYLALLQCTSGKQILVYICMKKGFSPVCVREQAKLTSVASQASRASRHIFTYRCRRSKLTSSSLQMIESGNPSSTISSVLIGNDNETAAGTETERGANNGTSAPSRPEQMRELAICAVFFGLCLLVNLIENPYERPIPYQLLEGSSDYVRNLTNDQPFHGETVSDLALIFFAAFLPLFIQVALSLIRRQPEDSSASVCVYLVAFGLNAVATESVKLYAGYLRPIFYHVCEPEADYQSCASGSANSARKSFPSGHASQSFCGLTLLALFLHARFGLGSIREIRPVVGLDPVHYIVAYKKRPSLYRMISVLSLLPMALALFIAASRVHDNKHFPADVVGGAVLGGSIAVFVNGLWFDRY